MIEWRAPDLAAPKDRDFALLLGPTVETAIEDAFDWEAARTLAAANTRLRPGDLLAGPVLELHEEDRERRLRRLVRRRRRARRVRRLAASDRSVLAVRSRARTDVESPARAAPSTAS